MDSETERAAKVYKGCRAIYGVVKISTLNMDMK
jgi:hypothetical protein